MFVIFLTTNFKFRNRSTCSKGPIKRADKVFENSQDLKSPGKDWRRMSCTVRSNDLKLQKLQASMLKQMALATITRNKLHKAKSDNTKTMSQIIKLALKYCADSAMLLGKLNSDLLSRRREFSLPELNVSYRQLSCDQKAYSKWLFGDNLPQVIEDITEQNKVGLILVRKTQASNYN